jgi:hypothetical protein
MQDVAIHYATCEIFFEKIAAASTSRRSRPWIRREYRRGLA